MKQPTVRGWAWIIGSLAFASLAALAIVSAVALVPHTRMLRQATAPILPLYSAATEQERGLRDELAAAYRWVGSGNPEALSEVRGLLAHPGAALDPQLRAYVPPGLRVRLDRADSLVAAAESDIAQALAERTAGHDGAALALLAAASADRRLVAAQMSDLVTASVAEARALEEQTVSAAERARLIVALSVVLALGLLAASVTLLRDRVIRPIARLHEDVRAIAAGDLAHRAAEAGTDEIGDLSRDVNQMTAALEARIRQNDRLRAVGELAAGLAHELNNPLQVILARSSQALAGGTPEEGRESMRLIQEHARRAGRVVAGLLSFVRARSGERAPADVNAIVSATVGLFGDEFAAEHVALDVRLADRPCVSRVDRTQIEQLLVNVLANGLHAAARAPRTRTVLVETRAETDTVVVAVEDSGPGIPADVRPRIFDPFFTTGGSEGAGLGLSIAAQIALAHSGRLALVDGTLGGARFELRLPSDALPAQTSPRPAAQAAAAGARPPSTAPGPERTASPPPAAAGCLEHLRLLVADDEEAVRKTWERYFTRLGATVTVAGDGQRALDLMRGQDFDAVVLDLKMPVLDGWDVVQAARRERPDLASRIIIVSGDATGLFDLQTAEHLEPWRVLEKPVDLDAIRQAVLRASQLTPRS